MDRPIIYPMEVPDRSDLLYGWQRTMVAFSNLAQATLGRTLNVQVVTSGNLVVNYRQMTPLTQTSLSSTTTSGVAALIGAAYQAALGKKNTLYANINAASTVADVQAIIWS